MDGIVIVDKPQDWTSQDVTAKLRGVFHERRIGHSGTLDPMATGVLVLFVGRATRAAEFAESDSKEQKVNINTADVSELTTLTGIGETRARAIIAWREQNGDFSSPEDLKNVEGIADKTYEKIKDRITVN